MVTDTRVAIVRKHDRSVQDCMTEAEILALLSELDAAMQSPDVVERVASAIHEARYLEACEIQGMPYPEWDSLPEHERDDYRAEALAALAAAVGGTKP